MNNDIIFSGREFNKTQHQRYREEYPKLIKLDKSLERIANFEDFIIFQIEMHSVDYVRDEFENLKNFWVMLGRDLSDANDVYYEYISKSYSSPYKSKQEIFDEIDSIVENATNHYPYVLEDIYSDGKYSQIEEQEEIKKSNSIEKEKEDNFKWFNPFSYTGTGVLYMVIAGNIIYFLYNNISITFTGFVTLGALAFFAFTHFKDNYKKK